MKICNSRLWLVHLFESGNSVSLRESCIFGIRRFNGSRACNGGGVRCIIEGTLLLSQVLLGRNNGWASGMSSLFLLADGTESFLVCTWWCHEF
jgi:hypothetical protein